MGAESGRRVCVIGAGIAGLVTAKVFKEDGFEVEVFEKLPEPGGVWAPSRAYPGLRANNPRETYAFSDYPYPETADDFPTAEQVRSYLASYADRFGLMPLIRFSTEVLTVSRGGIRTFEVTIRTGGASREARFFDFVVICNGVFSEPRMPDIEGRALFSGPMLHSSRLTDPTLMEEKRVLIVGSGKSAMDCASWAATHGRACTLVFRTPHWMVPRYYFGRIRLDRVLMTRMAEFLLCYHRLSRCEAFLHGPAKPLVLACWRGYGRLLRRLLRMPPELTPDTPLPQGFEFFGAGSDLYEVLNRGKLSLKRAGIRRFTGPSTIELDTGETVEADVVVFATGWTLNLSFLSPDLRGQILRDGQLRLYRNILPPRQPELGFIGYASSTACQLTSEIAAHWLSQHFMGELPLPGINDMEKEISRVLQWASHMFPGRVEGYYIGPFVAHYLDDLLRDMGLPVRRTSNLWKEYFAPLWPDRYRTVGEERRRIRSFLL